MPKLGHLIIHNLTFHVPFLIPHCPSFLMAGRHALVSVCPSGQLMGSRNLAYQHPTYALAFFVPCRFNFHSFAHHRHACTYVRTYIWGCIMATCQFSHIFVPIVGIPHHLLFLITHLPSPPLPFVLSSAQVAVFDVCAFAALDLHL